MQSRANGLATYRNSDFFGLIDGLNFALQYQGKMVALAAKMLPIMVGGYSVRTVTDSVLPSPMISEMVLSAGVAYSHSRRTDVRNKLAVGRGDDAETYTGGLKYNANRVYLATQFTQTYNATQLRGNGGQDSISGFANKAQNLEMVAQYQFDSGLQPPSRTLQSKGKDIEGFGGSGFIEVYRCWYDI